MAKQIPEFISYKVSAFDTDKQARQVVKFNEWNNIKLLQLGNNYHDDYWKSVHNYLFEDDEDGASMKTQWDWINNQTCSIEFLDPDADPEVTRTLEGDHYNFHFAIPQGTKGDKGDTGDAAGFGTPTISVDSNIGTPSATITTSGPDTAKIFNFAFRNLKGAKGDTGTAAGFGIPTITVGTGTEDPTATITSSGPDTAKVFAFSFDGLKGKKGDKGDTGNAAGFGTPTVSVNSSTGTPSATITTSGPDTAKVFNFAFSNLKGAQGDTGLAAGFGTPTATVSSTVGTPGVTITSSGPDTAKIFNFAFTNLKGDQGIQGIQGDPAAGVSWQTTAPTADNTSGTLKIVVLSSTPATLYNGWLYLITE